MSYSVNLPTNSQGFVTISVSFFDFDQDAITISRVAVSEKNSIPYTLPQTFSWLTYTTSGTYLAPGGYKGSLSKLDLFIYIDTDHPDIETGSQYVLRIDYEDGRYPSNSVYLNYYNGSLEFETLPYFYYGIPTYLLGLANYALVDRVTYSSTIPGALTLSDLSGGASSIRYLRSAFGQNVAAIFTGIALVTSSYFPNPLSNGKDIYLYYLFAPTESLDITSTKTTSIRLRTAFTDLLHLRLVASSANSLVLTLSNNFFFPSSSARITFSNYTPNVGCVLFEFLYRHSGTYSLLVNSIPVFTAFNVTYSSLDNTRVEILSTGRYGDIIIYSGNVSDQERNLIRNKFIHKYYPFLKIPPLFTISVGNTQIYP